ncbi:uncharacterized protein A4U43_C04F27100 [Asparagus officinalis]|uniref:Uncharacterized protein n=1 Tax=Asparagus officinalis TaxID=4686 RepID=A0A5P1F8V7_ASPOF|nr:uncharacterized protein A4U43_C04F27100 [Asparagus officinalis]
MTHVEKESGSTMPVMTTRRFGKELATRELQKDRDRLDGPVKYLEKDVEVEYCEQNDAYEWARRAHMDI